MIVVTMAGAAVSQDINFNDLKRPGKNLTKTVVIPNTANESQEYLKRFDEMDTVRFDRIVEAQAAARVNQQRYENVGKDGEGRWICTFKCTVGGLGESRGPFTERFSGSTRSDAKRSLENIADKLCRKLRGDGLFFANQIMYATDSKCE